MESRKLEVGSRKSEVGSGKWEVGSQKSEVRSWKWEVGSGKSEVGSRKLEVGSGKWEVRSRKSLLGFRKEIGCFTPAGTVNLPLFQGTKHDHVQVEISSNCFPRELVS